MDTRRDNQEIACQQVLVDDSSVFSVQWSIFPARIAGGLTARRLLDRYLAHIRRPPLRASGPWGWRPGTGCGRPGDRLGGSGFWRPGSGEASMILRICGGLLVQSQQCHRGELRFSVEAAPEGVRVALQLSDYCPLILGGPAPSPLRRWLYRLTQAAIHRLVTIRFLTLLYRDLAGSAAPVRVVNVNVRDGLPL